jgi:hypothetical protein
MEKLLTILKLLPAIIAAVQAIEAAVPEAGKGAEKLEAVRQILQTLDDASTTLWPQIAATIGVLVNLFNTVGAFKKTAAA